MSRSTLTMAVAVTLLLVAPIAGAKWMSYGTYEPDTTFDTSQFMTQDDPGTAVNSTVYFNAYPKNMCTGGANGCWINPNSGELETHVDLVAGTRTWQAILGIWTDCNGDGYVGLRESAAIEYRSEVLTTPLSNVGTSVCPPKTGAIERWSSQGASANNWNGWVTELIPIGGLDYEKGDDKRVFADPRAMVWAEPGTPDAPVGEPPAPDACPAITGWKRGPAADQDEGDAHTLGGMLAVSDCYHGGGRVDGVSVLATFDAAAAGSGLEWGADPKHSSSPLNVNFGSDNAESGGVMFKAQDCGSGRYGPGQSSPDDNDPETLNTNAVIPDELDNELSDVDDLTLLRPIPPGAALNADPSSWSIPATVNYTVESMPETPGGEPGPGPTRTSDCNFENDPGYDYYGNLEGNPQVFLPTGKVAATTNAVFNTGARGSIPLGFAVGAGAGTDRADNNAGIPLLGAQCGDSGCPLTQWVFGGINDPLVSVRPIFRGSDATVVDTGNPFPDAQHFTFYAYVDPDGIVAGKAKPSGGGANYGGGANSCGTFGAGTPAGDMTSKEQSNWQCNPNLWYRSADGLEITRAPSWCQRRPCTDAVYAAMLGLPSTADLSIPLAKVHQKISFRDVDCVDGSIGSTGLATMPSGLSATTKCARP